MNREIATGAASIYPLTGDVSSSAGSPTVTVTGIQGIPVEQAFITDDDFLVYDNTLNMWVPRLIEPSDLPIATTSSVGVVKPDGTTITIAIDGTISAAPTTSFFREIPSGTLNGTNKVFTLSFTPSPSASLTVFLNGVEQVVGTDITVVTTTITFTKAPISTDLMVAVYTH